MVVLFIYLSLFHLKVYEEKNNIKMNLNILWKYKCSMGLQNKKLYEENDNVTGCCTRTFVTLANTCLLKTHY